MRRFTFTTSSVPKYSGEGVDWENNRCTYRLSVDDSAYFAPCTAAMNDLEYQYGGLPDFAVTYTD